MVETTDVIVLGVGTSGEDVALRLLDAGLEVTGIEAYRTVARRCPLGAVLVSRVDVALLRARLFSTVARLPPTEREQSIATFTSRCCRLKASRRSREH